MSDSVQGKAAVNGWTRSGYEERRGDKWKRIRKKKEEKRGLEGDRKEEQIGMK